MMPDDIYDNFKLKRIWHKPNAIIPPPITGCTSALINGKKLNAQNIEKKKTIKNVLLINLSSCIINFVTSITYVMFFQTITYIMEQIE